MTDTRFYLLHPQDTLFFRDGRPFEQADDGLAAAASLFPPHPASLTGAMRAALALGQGWDGRRAWTTELTGILGDGPAMEGGKLRFGPPLLMRWIDNQWQALYPAPRHLIVRGTPQEWEFARLQPSCTTISTDLGCLHPVLAPQGWAKKETRPATDWWLTAEGLRRVLTGASLSDLADHAVHTDALWRREPRVGLELDATSRTAVRGNLYAATHVRLQPGVALGVTVSGVPTGWTAATRIPLGGEHRYAHVEPLAPPPPLPTTVDKPDGDGWDRVCLTLLSPARPPKSWLQPGLLPESGVEILGACLGDPVPIGGWDSRAGASRGPQALRPFLPAGSCWFLRRHPGATLPETLADSPDNRHGFGRYALGTFDFHK